MIHVFTVIGVITAIIGSLVVFFGLICVGISLVGYTYDRFISTRYGVQMWHRFINYVRDEQRKEDKRVLPEVRR